VTVEVRLRPEAEQDVVEAALWYEEIESGLGAQFVDQVQATINTIAEQPSAFTDIHKSPVRRALVRRFPFGVFYQIDKDGVMVIAVLHGSRHPRTWKDRP
jgi:plasmid stabilization system protein ParE